jgi:hypothetical protein
MVSEFAHTQYVKGISNESGLYLHTEARAALLCFAAAAMNPVQEKSVRMVYL